MRYAKELTLRLANRSGLLAEITSALWRKGVNIHAFSAEVDGRDGTLHLIVDKFTVAKKTLVENGWEAAEEKVLVLTLVDKPESLAFIASKLAEIGINTRHAYAGAADAGAADKGEDQDVPGCLRSHASPESPTLNGKPKKGAFQATFPFRKSPSGQSRQRKHGRCENASMNKGPADLVDLAAFRRLGARSMIAVPLLN